MTRFLAALTPLPLIGLLLAASALYAAEEEKPAAWDAAVKAIERGRSFKRRGYFDEAREQFEIARQLAPAGSEVQAQATLELHYQLPLVEIQHRVNAGDLDGAERILQAMVTLNQEQPERLQQIETMLRNLGLMRGATSVVPIAVDHKTVIEQVRRRLEVFRREQGRYPAGYRELNAALPANRPPLEHFVVNHYADQGNGYVLVLRNRYDPEQTLTLQNTGLLR